MEAFNTFRPKLWACRGPDLLGLVAYLHIDGTLAPTTGRKKEVIDISFNGIWRYHALVVSLANTREVLYLVNRSGNVLNHAGAAHWINAAVDLITQHMPRVRLRGDTDFSLTANFDSCAERADFVFGMDNTTALRARAQALADTARRRLDRPTAPTIATGQARASRHDVKTGIVTERHYLHLRLDYEDLAEFIYTPGKCAPAYRLLALRKNISRVHAQHVLLD